MQLEVEKYQRKPFPVTAVRVTEENFKQVRKWCDGTIKKHEGSGASFIFVRVNNPAGERQNQAYVGDWVVYMPGAGYKVYGHASFKRTFVKVEVEKVDPAVVEKQVRSEAAKKGIRVIKDARLRNINLVAEEPDPSKGVYPVEEVKVPKNAKQRLAAEQVTSTSIEEPASTEEEGKNNASNE